MSERQLRNWVHRYNAEGVAGLRDRPRPGQPPHLASDQVERFKQRIRAGARPEDEVCVLRGTDVQRILQKEFEAAYSLPGVYFLLHRLGFSSLVPRPRHQHADEQVQAAFKKTSRSVSKRSKQSTPTSGSRCGSKTKRVSASKGR
jgi:transposase